MTSILIIDDDDLTRAFLRDVLEVAGHLVAEAADGDVGLRTFADLRPGVVLCDLFMPQKEGLETIRAMRRLDPACRIVAMSGGYRDRADFLPMAREFGADAVLHKPFDRRQLATIVHAP